MNRFALADEILSTENYIPIHMYIRYRELHKNLIPPKENKRVKNLKAYEICRTQLWIGNFCTTRHLDTPTGNTSTPHQTSTGDYSRWVSTRPCSKTTTLSSEFYSAADDHHVTETALAQWLAPNRCRYLVHHHVVVDDDGHVVGPLPLSFRCWCS